MIWMVPVPVCNKSAIYRYFESCADSARHQADRGERADGVPHAKQLIGKFKPRLKFSKRSMISFRVATLEDWTDIMYYNAKKLSIDAQKRQRSGGAFALS
jgi:hypothetical protein